jgi:hypothetical protein
MQRSGVFADPHVPHFTEGDSVGDYADGTSSSPNQTWVGPLPRCKTSSALLPIFRGTFVVYYSLLTPLQSSLWFRIWARCDTSCVIDCSLYSGSFNHHSSPKSSLG